MSENPSESRSLGRSTILNLALLRKVGALLQLRAGEGPLAGLLLALSFLSGMSIALTGTAGMALFMEQHGSTKLPLVYVAASILIPLIGTGYVALEKRIRLEKLAGYTLALMGVGELVLRLALAFADPKYGAAALPVWAEVETTLAGIAFWSLAGRVFNVQQGKRLFGLIGAGTTLSTMTFGFLTPMLVSLMGTANILIASMAGWVGTVALLFHMSRRYRERLDGEGEEHAAEVESASNTAEARESKGYVVRLLLLIGLMFVVHYIVDAMFYDQAEARYPDAEKLAGFIGLFFGLCSLFELVFRLWLSGLLLGRFGLTLGLLALPVLMLVTLAASSAVGLTVGAGTALFALVAFSRAGISVLDNSITSTSILLLYQPLPARVRASTLAIAESMAGPIAGGITGGLLLLLMTHLHWDATRLAFAGAVVAIGWVAVSHRQRHAYRTMLEKALAGRRIDSGALSLEDASTREVLERGLESPHAGEVLYSVATLEEVAPELIAPVLIRLLKSPLPEVRRDVLLRIERLVLVEALSAVQELFEVETDLSVQGAILRVVASLGDSGLDFAVAHLDSPEKELRAGAMVGLLRSGDVDGIVAAGQKLGDLTRSARASDRILAAELLGEVGLDGFYRPLMALLADRELPVRRAALEACAHTRNPRLWSLLVEGLRVPALRPASVTALVAAGESVIPAIEPRAVAPSLDSVDAEVRSRLARVLGRIGGKRATAILRRMLDSAEEEVRPAVLAALVQCGYRAGEADAPRIRALIAEELADVCRTLAAIIDIGDNAQDILSRALQRELDLNRERLLLLLATLYDARSLQRAQLNFQSASLERRAIALELLDNLLPIDLKQTICPLFDELSPTECLRKLAGKTTQARTKRERRREILQRSDLLTTRWTFACALYQAGLDHDTELLPQATSLAQSPDPVLRETARWVVAALSSPNTGLTRDSTMLLTIEKVMILKSVPMFAHTPDDVLAEVAMLLKEVRVVADEVVFTKGDLGDSLYILVDGAVKIHDGDKVFKLLSERDVFGEMAVLDPEPRSASVTGTAPSLLFRLDQAEFYELMADRVEMLRGILRLLCQRLRHMNEHTSLAEEKAA